MRMLSHHHAAPSESLATDVDTMPLLLLLMIDVDAALALSPP